MNLNPPKTRNFLYNSQLPPPLITLIHRTHSPQTLAMASLLSVSSKPRLPLKTLANPRQISSSQNAAAIDLRFGRLNVSLGRGLAASTTEGLVVSIEEMRDKRTKPIVVIDNYDSFTYNLCQYMGETGAYFEVYRNDELTVEELKRKNPRGVVISPGPGAPKDSGISLQTVLELGPSIPLFGVCMGLQCIGEAFGGKIVRAPSGVVHGKRGIVYYNENQEDTLFGGLPNPFIAGRYHSLVIENESFPSDFLEITAWTEDRLVMGVQHKKYKHIQGVQFHPESIITQEGKTIIINFIKQIEKFEVESQK